MINEMLKGILVSLNGVVGIAFLVAGTLEAIDIRKTGRKFSEISSKGGMCLLGGIAIVMFSYAYVRMFILVGMLLYLFAAFAITAIISMTIMRWKSKAKDSE
jgi:uncharacterized membrane protein HdeD (DUF308 family)